MIMSQAKSGDTVHAHYTGKLDDGTVFDTSEGRDPLTFQLGVGHVVPGFDKAVTGMKVGEKKTVTFPSDEAYGPRLEQLVFLVPGGNLPAGYDPKKGRPWEWRPRMAGRWRLLSSSPTRRR